MLSLGITASLEGVAGGGDGDASEGSSHFGLVYVVAILYASPSVDLALDFNFCGFGCVLNREMFGDQTDGDEERFGEHDASFERGQIEGVEFAKVGGESLEGSGRM